MAAARETTEWEDVQHRFGNIVGPTQELLVTEDTVAALIEAEAEAARERAAQVETRFADANRNQLDEADDSILEEDERAFEAFRYVAAPRASQWQCTACMGLTWFLSQTLWCPPPDAAACKS